VWSMYLLAVRFVFRVARSGSEDAEAHSIIPKGLV
jgi:hypothetical protein